MRYRNATKYGPAFDHSGDWANISDGLVVNPDGSLAHMTFAPNASSGSHHGDSFRLCHAAPAAVRRMGDTVDEALGYAPLVSFDQEMGGGAGPFPCYSTSHGHPPGRGNWEWASYRDNLKAIRARALAAGREVALMQEQVCELTIPYLAASWSRQFWQLGSQGGGMEGPGSSALDAVNVGAFSYMYHEHALALAAAQFQGQGELYKQGQDGEPYELRSLVIMSGVARGLMPAPFANDVNDTRSPTRDEWHTRIAAANAAANSVWAAWPDVLTFAAAVAPPLVDGPTVATHEVVAAQGGNTSHRPLVLPATQVGSYLLRPAPTTGGGATAAATATVATVLLNSLWSVASLAVQLPWAQLAAAQPIELRNGTTRELLGSWPAGQRSVQLRLGPLGSAVLLVPNATLCTGERPCIEPERR